mmetsp:Transcript_10611/g.31332  ORF Transcript_10611/g.31332 Transcript_10611/m.31332 type:complete len:1013 (-) Transcript_10611:417-3455(-)
MQLLGDSAALAAAMTQDEHTKASKFALVFFLGYILPNCTGSGDLLHIQCKQGGDKSKYPFGLDLEELLENCSRSFSSFGNADSCSDELVKVSFRKFLRLGLGPFLNSRFVSQTDLLHVMAMAVSPSPIESSGSELQNGGYSELSFRRTKRLMACVYAHNFRIGYSARKEVVRILEEHLSLPEFDSIAQQRQNSESMLFNGAVTHLRASLKGFAASALSQNDAISACHVLVRIAVYSGHQRIILGELEAMVSKLVGNGVNVCHCFENESNSVRSNNTTKCPNREYCNLIKELIMKYNGCRHYADGLFTRKALSILTREITNHSNGMDNTCKDEEKICRISALIECAKVLFYFLLDSKVPSNEVADASRQFADADEDGAAATADYEGQKEEDQTKDTLLKCTIQCIGHGNQILVKSSASLVALALAYGGKGCADMYAESIFANICSALLRQQQDASERNIKSSLQGVISAASRKSPKFAESLLVRLIGKGINRNGVGVEPEISCLVSSIVLSQPPAILGHAEHLVRIEPKGGDRETSHVIATLLSCRLSYFMSSERHASLCSGRAHDLIKNIHDSGTLLRLMQHAIVTSNFQVARSICDSRLMNETSSPRSYLWLKALSRIVGAEELVGERGSLGIPEALPHFCVARSYIDDVSSFCATVNMSCIPADDFSFQKKIVSLRIEFLKLCVVTRGLCSETLLTNVTCSKTSRSHLHQTNVFQCFYALASRYKKLHRVYGIFFGQQTRSSLRTLFAVCRFLGSTAAKLFGNIDNQLFQSNMNAEIPWPQGDTSHPIVSAMSRFEKGIIRDASKSTEPSIRAGVLMEIIDVLLRCPWPMPRGFFSPISIPVADMQILATPSEVHHSSCDDSLSVIEDEAEVIYVLPGLPCTVHLSGQIPPQYFSRSKLSFSQVVAWYTISYDGPIVSEDELMEEDQFEGPNADEVNKDTEGESETTFASSLLPNGKFLFPVDLCPLRREGYYIVSITLGCRDVRFGEWEIPTARNSGKVFLCVSMQSDA